MSDKPIVSPEDQWLLERWKWRKNADGYWVRHTTSKGKSQTIRLHRLITNAPKHLCVDHANGNVSDNRRENLRLCTALENARNRRPKPTEHGFKGVAFKKGKLKKPYCAQITVNNSRRNLGYFHTPLEAALVYDQAAAQYYGEFAWLNFPSQHS